MPLKTFLRCRGFLPSPFFSGVCWETLPSWLSLPPMTKSAALGIAQPLHLQQPRVRPCRGLAVPWDRPDVRSRRTLLLNLSVGPQGSGGAAAGGSSGASILPGASCGAPSTTLLACGESQTAEDPHRMGSPAPLLLWWPSGRRADSIWTRTFNSDLVTFWTAALISSFVFFFQLLQ